MPARALRSLALGSLLLLLSRLVAAQDDAINAADRAFQKQQWAAAEAAYAPLAASDTKGLFLYRLALSRHQQGKFAAAEEAYAKAFKLGFRTPGGLYNFACAQARVGKADDAFKSLALVVQNPSVSSEQFVNDDDLASLRKDPRWEPLIAKLRKIEHPCAGADHRAFDFWAGAWLVKNPSGIVVGKSRVDRILNDCVLLENWTDAAGHEGKSFNRFDEPTRKWRQTWVDHQGTQTDYVGTFEGEALVFLADGAGPTGAPQKTRMTFTQQGPPHAGQANRRTVRQYFETSDDGGKTWQPSFDGFYEPQ